MKLKSVKYEATFVDEYGEEHNKSMLLDLTQLMDGQPDNIYLLCLQMRSCNRMITGRILETLNIPRSLWKSEYFNEGFHGNNA